MGVGGSDGLASPDDARVPRVLPGGADGAVLGRVGAEEVRGELRAMVVEQGGLRGEENPGEAGVVGTRRRRGRRVRARQADVVLGADSVPQEERRVPRW